jgi:hypothetical protein
MSVISAVEKRIRELEKTKYVSEYLELINSLDGLRRNEEEVANPSKLDIAVKIISQGLEPRGEWHASKSIWDKLDSAGVGDGSLVREARNRLGVRMTRESSSFSEWHWRID